ncbi:MAG: NAD(P)H-hydrate dehydratase [Alphaproteobacteria bacterium]|nr:NAD(P)H-hydrate dehydratase [Alphaproteobacteria bacterium]
MASFNHTYSRLLRSSADGPPRDGGDFAAPELLTPEGMARADAFAIAAGMPGIALMENAGRAVARAIRRRFRPVPTLVLCGPGNNGGDGFVIARRLEEAGWGVRVALLGARDALAGDAVLAASRWRGAVARLGPDAVRGAGLIVDALFGAGLARPVAGAARATLEAAAASGGPIVAVDLPSGVNGATGAVLGYAAPAALTVTFFRLKPGHLLQPGRALCGETVCAEIGIPAAALAAAAPDTWRNDPALWGAALRAAQPDAASHKYSRGHLTILGGAVMTGAARLAARAARRAGAGMVTLLVPPEAAGIYRAGDPGVIVHGLDGPDTLAAMLADARRTTWLLGPGAGVSEALAAQVAAVLGAGRRTVLDADALTAFAGRAELLSALVQAPAILTPHAGEFARLFGPLGEDRLAAARAAARQSGAVVLLKGSDSIIAAPDGTARINANAPSTLATAGTGDVLAGIAAAFLAQGLDATDAAPAAAWVHAEAASRAGAALIAEDVIEALPGVFTALQARLC